MKTKSNASSKPRRGSVGYAIAQLVKKYGHGPNGIYILERALAEAATGDSESIGLVTISGRLVHECDGYKKAKASEEAAIARLKAGLVII